jgi:hypothetical protein
MYSGLAVMYGVLLAVLLISDNLADNCTDPPLLLIAARSRRVGLDQVVARRKVMAVPILIRRVDEDEVSFAQGRVQSRIRLDAQHPSAVDAKSFNWGSRYASNRTFQVVLVDESFMVHQGDSYPRVPRNRDLTREGGVRVVWIVRG